MSDNTEELLPCPFCGSTCVNDTCMPDMMDLEEHEKQYYWVCPECCTSGPIKETLEECNKAWNTRPQNNVGEALETIKDLLISIDITMQERHPKGLIVRQLTKLQNLLGGA